MITHPYLEHGLTILHTRLGQPNPSRPAGVPHGIRPFVTLSRETGAGASTVGQLLVPLLERSLGSEGHHWVLLDKDLLTHALTHHRLPERLAAFAHEAPHSVLVLGRALRVGGYGPPGSNAYRALMLSRVPVMMHVARE